MSEPMISFAGVTKNFGALNVLDDLCMEVAKGEKVTIIGPSGSGKTTVLRVLMTLEPISGGMISIDGRPFTHMRRGETIVAADEAHRRRVRGDVGMVFQHFNLFPHMTALRNCTVAPIRALGLDRAEAEGRALDLLRLVGLSDRALHYPAQLSGGQQQRVAIARALAMRPKVLLLDEITSALDPEVVGEVQQVVRDVAAEHGLTILMVTHQMSFAREFSDRVCFFHQGRIHEEGSPGQLFDDPRQERTRAFLRAVKGGV